MTTDNKKVSSYVPQSIYEKLVEFKRHHQLKSVSQALSLIVHEHFGILPTQEAASFPSDGVSSRLLLLEETVMYLTQQQEQIKQALAQVQTTINDETGKTNANAPTHRRILKRTAVITPLEPHGGTALARRLGVSKSTISLYKQRTDFPEWSRSRDPEGVAWMYKHESKQFNYLNPQLHLRN